MSTAQPNPATSLEDAFQAFNEMSQSLASSYGELQSRVDHMTSELAKARSERMRQLAEKERLANRLSGLLAALPGGVVVLDGQGCIQDSNPVARDFLGLVQNGASWEALQTRELQPLPGEAGEFRLKDGRQVSVRVSQLEHEPGAIVLLTDVTETRAMQEMLNRHQRLTAMGEMAAGLAHQIRTPLASALLYAGHLKRDDLIPQDRQKFSNRMVSRLRHIEKQVNDMLVFARGGQAPMELMPVSGLLDDLRETLDAHLGDQVELDIQDQGRAAVIEGNHDALLGVLVNLANNAMETGQRPLKLTVEVQRCKDTGVEIHFTDNGPGMDSETAARAFDPFYTTRSDGTGLGLAVAQAVVHAHRGTLRLETIEGQGCRFVMAFAVAAHESTRLAG